MLSGNNVEAPVNVTVNVCGNTASVVGLLNPASGTSCGTGGPAAGASREGGRHSAQRGPGPRSGHSPQGGHGARAHGTAHGSPGVGSGNDVQVPVDVPVNVCGDSVSVVGIGNGVWGEGCEAPSAGNPGGPGQPGNPGRPGDPGGPGDPGNPGGPGNPGDPGNPGSPSDPSGGGTPSHPGGPGQPGTGPGDVIRAGSQPEAGPVTASSVPVTDAVSDDDERDRTGQSGQKADGGELAQTGGGSGLGVVAPLGAGTILGGYVLFRRSRASARV